MRALILLAVVSLVGCANFSSFKPPAATTWGGCGAVAKQRLSDAEMMGLAEGYEKAIFDRSYQDCLKVEAASASRSVQEAADISGR